jgi:hypothetical protein
MRRLVLILLIFIIGFTPALFAQETNEASGLEPLMEPGNIAVSAGLGYGFFFGAIDVSGGLEVIVARVDLGGELPITFGVAGKVNYYRYNYTGFYSAYHYTYLGGGAFGTVHLGLKDLDLDDNLRFLANVDTYVGLGMGFYSYSSSYDDLFGYNYDSFQIGLRSTAGINYFLTPNVALTVEGGYYGAWGGGGLFGILVKF